MMRRALKNLAVPLLGLLFAQIIATVQVYSSNSELHRTLLVLKEAGYLIVPNQQILSILSDFKPAFWGGLFFTLTIGVFLTFLSWATAWAWNRLFSRNRLFLYFCLLAWLSPLILINSQGLNFIVTLYFLIVPATVFAAASKLSNQEKGAPGYRSLLLLVPFLVLAGLWGTRADSDFFLNLRDRVLLSNPVGAKVSDFYYEYTFYPAETFKSLDQKLLKSCSIAGIQRKADEQALEKTLIAHDYLPVDRARYPADLVVREDNGLLFFEHREKSIVQTNLQEFLAGPGKVLEAFSHKTDTASPFRAFILFSLLVSLPLVLYAVCFSLFFLISSFVLSPKVSSWTASVLCLFLGSALFFYITGSATEESSDLARALASDRWETRVAALKLIEQKRLDVADFEPYPRLMRSPHAAERYWVARALGFSKQTNAFKDLLGFLDDPSAGVVSMAFYALGQRKDSRAVPEILKRIETSGSWYNQWYAYRALRNKGWKQDRSR